MPYSFDNSCSNGGQLNLGSQTLTISELYLSRLAAKTSACRKVYGLAYTHSMADLSVTENVPEEGISITKRGKPLARE